MPVTSQAIPTGRADEQVERVCNGISYRLARYGDRVLLFADVGTADEMVASDELCLNAGIAAAKYASDWWDPDSCVPRIGDLLQVNRPGRESLFVKVGTVADHPSEGWVVTGLTGFERNHPPRRVEVHLVPGGASFTWVSRTVR